MKHGFAVCIFAAMLVLPAWADSFDDFNQGVNALNRGDNDRASLLLTPRDCIGETCRNISCRPLSS